MHPGQRTVDNSSSGACLKAPDQIAQPHRFDIALIQRTGIHDRRNMVLMRTAVSHGRATAIVTATGMQTEIGRIAEAIRTAKKGKTPLQESVERLGHSLIWAVTGSVERLLAICTSLRERPRGIGPWMRPCVVVSSMPTAHGRPSHQDKVIDLRASSHFLNSMATNTTRPMPMIRSHAAPRIGAL